MIAVTIAVGDQYQRLAEAAATSCERYTGLATHIIRQTPGESKPARYKLQLLRLFPGQTALYFDADTRFLRPWDARGLDDIAAFAAVLDMSSAARDHDCSRYGIDPQRYFNSGIWIANARHAEAFAVADQICHAPDYRTGFRYEQTALNVAIQRLNVPVVFLDRRYNAICDPACKMPAEPVVVHRAGGKPGGDHERIFERTIHNAQCVST
jgi:lipopolysaccharide biosynthesis glycosyltransferase